MARNGAGAALRLVAICVLAAVASSQDEMECVATAIAATGQGEAAGEALSNAVAETLTEAVICEQGAMAQPGSVGGLSVAVALAISEASEIGQNCSADAEAAAEITSELVTDRVASELLNQVDGDEETLARAWLTARGPDVKAAVQDSPTFLGEDGCLDLEALSNGLPTAVELGVVLSDAVQQIIQAIQCGNNLEVSEEACIWEDRMFKGQCIGAGEAGDTGGTVDAPESDSGAATDRVTCLNEFADCRGADGADCSDALRECLEMASECTFC
eukprot:evm.model.scf_128EXC.18 EVM.evm.TU.scf_128EXC.18   scf_128EXC:125915-126733(-)